jgi:putative salt-induced outer membrane protein YdiY
MNFFCKTCFIGILVFFLPNLIWAHSEDLEEVSEDDDLVYISSLDLDQNELRAEIETGLAFTTGNMLSISLSGEGFLLYRVRRFENTFDVDVKYDRVNQSTDGDTGTFARYIFGTYRLDTYFLDKMTLYTGGGAYTDDIAGIQRALLGFAGMSLYLFREEGLKLNVSAGYIFTHQKPVGDDPSQRIHAAESRLLYEQDLGETLRFSQTIQVSQNTETLEDLSLNAETELKFMMTQYLALIASINLQYDNDPVPGFKKFDTISNLSVSINF